MVSVQWFGGFYELMIAEIVCRLRHDVSSSLRKNKTVLRVEPRPREAPVSLVIDAKVVDDHHSTP
jgi:hypothetical protein